MPLENRSVALHCTLYNLQYTLFIAHCTINLCTLYMVHSTSHYLSYIFLTAHYILHLAHNTLY